MFTVQLYYTDLMALCGGYHWICANQAVVCVAPEPFCGLHMYQNAFTAGGPIRV